jgi:hypothetical protein
MERHDARGEKKMQQETRKNGAEAVFHAVVETRVTAGSRVMSIWTVVGQAMVVRTMVANDVRSDDFGADDKGSGIVWQLVGNVQVSVGQTRFRCVKVQTAR